MKAKILLVLYSLLLTLVVLEVGVRIFQPVGSEQAPKFILHEQIGWVRTPNQGSFVYQQNPGVFKTKFQTNSRGMRDREYPLDKGEKIRIIALGDSITEGWGVEEQQAYPEILEDQFLQNVEVWNLGVVGYSTDMELQKLRQVIEEYRPDMVVLGFYGNDVADNTRNRSLWYPRFPKPLFELQGNELVFANAEYLANQKMAMESQNSSTVHQIETILQQSALFRFIRSSVRKIMYIRKAGSGMELQREVWMRNNPYRVVETEEMKKGWLITERLLVEMDQLCARYGAKFLLTYMPRAMEIVPGVLEFEQQKLGVTEPASTFDLSQPDRKVAEIAQRHGIPFVEMGSRFRNTAQPEYLYLPQILKDGHPSARGQFLIAYTLAEYFQREGLLPTKNLRTEGLKMNSMP